MLPGAPHLRRSQLRHEEAAPVVYSQRGKIASKYMLIERCCLRYATLLRALEGIPRALYYDYAAAMVPRYRPAAAVAAFTYEQPYVYEMMRRGPAMRHHYAMLYEGARHMFER